MFVLIRTLVYASLFVAFFLIFLPARVLVWAGVGVPAVIGPLQVLGATITVAGAVFALACVFAFTFIGKGTPAPFDPPRQLVERGPYGVIRNPMYVSATIALLGAALFYESWALAGFALAFLAVCATFVRWYEEPALRRTFGDAYAAYCARVGGWWPRRARQPGPPR